MGKKTAVRSHVSICTTKPSGFLDCNYKGHGFGVEFLHCLLYAHFHYFRYSPSLTITTLYCMSFIITLTAFIATEGIGMIMRYACPFTDEEECYVLLWGSILVFFLESTAISLFSLWKHFQTALIRKFVTQILFHYQVEKWQPLRGSIAY